MEDGNNYKWCPFTQSPPPPSSTFNCDDKNGCVFAGAMDPRTGDYATKEACEKHCNCKYPNEKKCVHDVEGLYRLVS